MKDFILTKLTLTGSQPKFEYLRDNPNIEGAKNAYGFKCPEQVHVDFNKAVKHAVEKYAEALGFEVKNADKWVSFQAKKIEIDGVMIKMDLKILTAEAKEINLKGPEYAMGEIAEWLTEESKGYIEGTKRQQGELFATDQLIYEIPIIEN